MEDVGIIIQARLGSTRLSKKMSKPFFEDASLLELLLDRLTSSLNCKIVLATTTNSLDNEIEEISKRFNLTLFRGSENDVLGRFIEAAKSSNLSKIIRVCADNPFFDVTFLKQLISFKDLDKYDYVSFTLDGNKPTIKNHIGLFAEYVSLAALEKVDRLTSDKLYREHVTNFIYENRNIFNIQLLEVPGYLKNRKDLRFTLDTEEDFILLQKLYAYYECNNKDVQKLIAFVDENPQFSEDMKAQINNNTK